MKTQLNGIGCLLIACLATQCVVVDEPDEGESSTKDSAGDAATTGAAGGDEQRESSDDSEGNDDDDDSAGDDAETTDVGSDDTGDMSGPCGGDPNLMELDDGACVCIRGMDWCTDDPDDLSCCASECPDEGQPIETACTVDCECASSVCLFDAGTVQGVCTHSCQHNGDCPVLWECADFVDLTLDYCVPEE